MDNKKIIFSGIQPSGNLHIGNYIGAISQWVRFQETREEIICIVDLHAITVPQDPKVLREKVLEVAALYVASGIDPQKAHIFVQSENPDHTYLAWVFDCILPYGNLARMTQFKDKALRLRSGDIEKNRSRNMGSGSGDMEMNSGKVGDENITVGLFNYPALMAADILLYDTDEVPVGEDQKQHVELTRDVAERFNRIYCHPELISGSRGEGMLKQVQHDDGECIFKLPVPVIQKETARIMSLQNPLSKMSKSDKDSLGTINLLDTKDQIAEKIRKAVTDSGNEIIFKGKPAIANLLTIYCVFSGMSPIQAEEDFRGKSYSEFKSILTDIVTSRLSRIQENYKQFREDEEGLKKVLDEGRDFATSKSSRKITQVKEAVGLGRV